MSDSAVIAPIPGTVINNRHAGLWRAAATSCRCECRRLSAHRAPRLEQGQDTPRQRRLPLEQGADVGLEDPAAARWNNQAKRPHEAADLVGEIARDADELGASAHQRPHLHRRPALHPNLPEEPGLGEQGQTVGVGRVGLVRRRVERRLGMPCVDAHRWQAVNSW